MLSFCWEISKELGMWEKFNQINHTMYNTDDEKSETIQPSVNVVFKQKVTKIEEFLQDLSSCRQFKRSCVDNAGIYSKNQRISMHLANIFSSVSFIS